jgi:hypothetical protein
MSHLYDRARNRTRKNKIFLPQIDCLWFVFFHERAAPLPIDSLSKNRPCGAYPEATGRAGLELDLCYPRIDQGS